MNRKSDQARRAGSQTSAQPGTRISCHAALDESARAPFSKERRMKFAKATKFHRKSGEGLGDRSPRLWSAGGAALPTFGVPRLRRSDDVAESMSQPSRAGLTFGYRPYGPWRLEGSAVSSGSHAETLAPAALLSCPVRTFPAASSAGE